ncbi:hypothetical protein KSC_048290 [Ktedonobacter sp. SOSP1-52]|nr:hypothetical protein KSC_048290 [Ktedonobacter sp. SOSP1-52]
MHLAAAQAVQGADNHALYFALTVALAYDAEFLPLAVLVAAPHFTVYQTDDQAVFLAIGTPYAFLFVQAGIVFLVVRADPSVNVHDVWHIARIPFSDVNKRDGSDGRPLKNVG